jgi:hypothetical protein
VEVLKKHCLRASVICVGWSNRPEAITRAGMSLCRWLKCHFAAVHNHSGVALWRNSLAQFCLAALTSFQRALLAALHDSGSWALCALAAARSHSLFHQEDPLSENPFHALKICMLVCSMSCMSCSASLSMSTVVESIGAVWRFVCIKCCFHQSWVSSAMMNWESCGGGGVMADSSTCW